MDKKAAIKLSIEALVTIILAAVFLGLAVGFVGYLFYTSDISIRDVFSSITKTRIEQLKMSEKSFDIEQYALDIKPGEKKTIFMLLRNEGDDESYSWQISHSISNITGNTDCSNILLIYKESIDVLPGQDSTPPLIIKADKKVNKGTCLFVVEAKDSEGVIKAIDLTVNII